MSSWRSVFACVFVAASVGMCQAHGVDDPWRMFEAPSLSPMPAPTIRVTTSQRDVVASAVLQRFDANAWEATVRRLADNGGTRSRYAWRVRDATLLNGHPPPDAAADMAADWIADELRSYGYSPTEQVFPHHAFAGETRAATFRMRNIIAEREAVGADAGGFILVTAHYDTKASRSDGWEQAWREMPAPGANDNATGVATVLELARLLASIPLRRSVRFALFSGEELGLIGSRHYAHAMRQAEEDIAAVINIDMVGHDSDGLYDLHVVANRQSRWLLEAVEHLRRFIDSDIALQPRVEPGSTFSDHAPFWWEGYSGVLVSEESDAKPAERHPTYHTSEDTAEHVNFEYGAEAARVIAGVVALLAEPATPQGASVLPRRDDTSVLQASVFPNPYASGSAEPLRVAYELSDAVDFRAAVYATSGRRVHLVAPEATAASRPVVVWDGSAATGGRAPAGVYYVLVEARDRSGARHARTLRVLVLP